MAVEDAAPPLPLDAPVAVVCGHYGVGKTNLTLNIALDAAAAGRAVTVIDLDVVNPFFRSSDYRALLDERGIRLVAPASNCICRTAWAVVSAAWPTFAR